jgi:hypothetical protein
MADFYEVHRKAIEVAAGKIRRGEYWTVPMIEPLSPVTLRPPTTVGTMLKTVRFIAAPDGTMKAATELDLSDIADWQRRHHNTPRESFGLPAILRSRLNKS